MGEENESNTKFNVSTGGSIEKKGKKKTVLVVIGILLLLAIVVGLVYYFTIYTKPEEMYKRFLKSTMNSYSDEITNMDYTTSKTSLKLDANLDTDKLDEKVIDLINQTDLEIEAQIDSENPQFLMNLKADYDKEDLIDIQLYSDIEKEETYMQFRNFLDKYIEVGNLDNEFYTYFKNILENQKKSAKQKESMQKAIKIVEKELTKVIKKEYCTVQKEDITINGKNIHATKNTIKMDMQQLSDECTTVFKNLKNNEEFINCFENKDEVSETLERLIEQMEDFDEDDKSTIEIDVYTKGLMQKVEKFAVTVYSKENNQTVSIAVTKTDEQAYNFEILQGRNSVMAGTVNLEEKNEKEGTTHLEMDIVDFGKLKLNIEYNQKLNENIDKVDVKNSIKDNQLSTEDQQTLVTNLQKSKLYELIASFSGNNDLALMEDTNYQDDKKDKQTTKTQDNEIISYDNKEKVTFKIPEGYESTYISDNYKSLEKEDTSIKVTTLYGNKDKYYEELQEKKKYYETESNYENVELSEIETMEVNGRTFYCAAISYEYSNIGYTTPYKTIYVWSEISNDYLLDIQILGSDNVTSEELKELLTIDVKNNE